MREIQVQQMIAGDRVSRADNENPAEQRAIDGVAGNADVARLHVRIAVVHDDAEVAVRIIPDAVGIDAGVSADLAIVKAVEVETLAVDLFELILAVDGFVDIPGRVDRDGNARPSRSTSSAG